MSRTTAASVLFVLLGVSWSVLVSCKEERNLTEVDEKIDESNSNNTPEYILPCFKKDPKIELCLQKSFTHIKPYLMKGIPELEVPSFEPLVIPEVKIENGQGPVNIKALFTNVTAMGLGNYTINKIRVNVSLYRFDLHVKFPKIELRGNYDVNGNVLLFPIQSHGDFWASLGDVLGIARLQGVEEVRNGVRYMKIARTLVDFKLGRISFHITDQLNGNNVIGQAMNQFLNQNAHEIIEEVKPAASVTIANLLKEFLNTAFTKIPIKIWMPDA